MQSLTYSELHVIHKEDSSLILDDLWKISLSVRSPRPGWSGMMNKGIHPGESSILFLPMLDIDPGNNVRENLIK